MKDIPSINYEDIESEVLETALKEQGMVFVKMSEHHARAYIKFLERTHRIEHGDRYKANRVTRALWLVQSIMALPIIVILHSKLLELDSFRIITKVRCTYEKQSNGSYVFIYS